jgi:hypothetical protein
MPMMQMPLRAPFLHASTYTAVLTRVLLLSLLHRCACPYRACTSFGRPQPPAFASAAQASAPALSRKQTTASSPHTDYKPPATAAPSPSHLLSKRRPQPAALQWRDRSITCAWRLSCLSCNSSVAVSARSLHRGAGNTAQGNSTQRMVFCQSDVNGSEEQRVEGAEKEEAECNYKRKAGIIVGADALESRKCVKSEYDSNTREPPFDSAWRLEPATAASTGILQGHRGRKCVSKEKPDEEGEEGRGRAAQDCDIHVNTRHPTRASATGGTARATL